MFTIKATYRGQTRKHTFQELNTFPGYVELCAQIHRLFQIPLGFYLSRLMLVPEAASPAHILISKEVRSAHDYSRGIRLVRDRKWRHAVLKFTICDTGSAPAPSWPFDAPVPTGLENSMSVDTLGSFHPSMPRSTFSACSLTDMDVDHAPSAASSITPRSSAQHSMPHTPQHRSSMASISSCCSVSEGKAEIKAMLNDLQSGLNRVLSSNLTEPLVISREPSVHNATSQNPPDLPPRSWCSVCRGDIMSLGNETIWYSCANCPVAICKKCHETGRPGYCFYTKAPHEMKLMNGGRPTNTMGSSFGATSDPLLPTPVASMVDSSQPIIHRGVICDSCNITIEGIRHKCVECDDYDLCSRCITSGGAERHDPFHVFVEIHEPGRVIVHTVDERPFANNTHTNENSVSSPVVHPATCDLCDSLIEGKRFKCLVCPDFDTCASCFTITGDQHPRHSFVRISKTEDYIKQPPSPPLRHYATCDACHKPISGIRFKCMHPECPDYDLCQNCEALPIAVHPPTHPMLKMKTPDTVIPTVYRVGQRSLIPETNRNEQPNTNHGNAQEIPGGAGFDMPLFIPRVWTPIDRVITPTPASAQREHAPLSQPEINLRDQTPSNPFADVFGTFAPTPTTPKVDAVPTMNPWPTTNTAERDELYQVMADLTGSSPSKGAVNQNANGASSATRVMSERSSLLDRISLVHTPSPPISPRGPSTDPAVPPSQDIQASPVLQLATGGTHAESSVSNGGVTTTLTAVDEIVPESIEAVPQSDDNRSAGQPQDGPSLELLSVRKSLANLIRELPSLVPPPVPGPKETTEISPARLPLSAAFVEDVTVPDGQVFPPGAEFVKCWRILNDSGREWPESTELVFLAGDSLSTPAAGSAPTDIVVSVGKTAPGRTVDVWTDELKAPETPGRYVGYWRLRADDTLFGHSLWIEINVAEADSRSAADESMASSAVIMPVAAASSTANGDVPSITVTSLSTQSQSVTSTTEDNVSEAGSDLSLISVPSSPSDDEIWHETRSGPSSNLSQAQEQEQARRASSVASTSAKAMDYVLLYDDESDSDNN